MIDRGESTASLILVFFRCFLLTEFLRTVVDAI